MTSEAVSVVVVFGVVVLSVVVVSVGVVVVDVGVVVAVVVVGVPVVVEVEFTETTGVVVLSVVKNVGWGVGVVELSAGEFVL